MNKMRWYSIPVALLWAIPSLAQDVSPGVIFGKVAAAYSSMQTYKGEGTVTSDIDFGAGKTTITTDFSLVLKKPNLYRISWAQKNTPMPGMEQAGTVWSDGTQPYLYMRAGNAYAKLASDMFALSAATGISGGAAFTIPSLFLPAFPEQAGLHSRLVDPKLEKSEPVGNEDCYVISGNAQDAGRETFWISKSRYLILKHWRSFESSGGGMKVPEATDEELQAALKGMGMEASEENKKSMRTMMKTVKESFSGKNIRSTSTEVYILISSPDLSKRDFEFTPPAGATLKESLFGGVQGIPQ